MSAGAWVAWAAAAVAAGALVASIYRLRETPVRGRALLAALRTTALALLLLLLWDPVLPPVGAGDGGERWIVVDASASMGAAADDGTVMEEARRVVDSLLDAGARRVVAFDALPRPLPPESAGAPSPGRAGSRVLPALRLAAESGARRVTVVSDLRLEEDSAALADGARELPLAVTLRRVGEGIRNAAVAAVEAPARGRAGEASPVTVEVAAPGYGPRDSLTVRLAVGASRVVERRIPAPGREGAVRRVELRAVPPSEGWTRLVARVEAPGDGFPDDDARTAYLRAGADEGRAVLVSLTPGWEPRFLLPVLEATTGLAFRGFLRAGSGRFVRMGAAEAAGEPVEEVDVRSAVREAELVVLDGLRAAGPEWALEAAREGGRVLLLAPDPGAARAAGLAAGPRSGGEWYVDPELPSSAISPELARIDVAGLPPLTDVLAAGGDGWRPGLRARRDRRGETRPALLLGGAGERRIAVAPARGYWRWAFRPGSPREAYRSLWSGVAGWLTEEVPAAAARAVRPDPRVVPRGEDVRWAAGRGVPGRLRVRVTAEGGGSPDEPLPPGVTGTDTVVELEPPGTFETGALAPGHYAYRVGSPDAGGAGGREVAGGPLTVEAFTDELLLPAREGWAAPDPGSGPRAPGRPLHTHPLPYVLLAGLLCAEWILRRRRGLR